MSKKAKFGSNKKINGSAKNSLVDENSTNHNKNSVHGHPFLSERKWSLVILIFALLITSSIYFRGTYFDQEGLIFTFLISALGLVTFYRLRRNKGESIDLLDIGFAALGLLYIVGWPFSVNKGTAALGVVRLLGYVILYFSLSRIITSWSRKAFFWFLSVNGALATLVGIGSSIGIPPIASGWGNVLSSSFQYHNAFAGYLLITISVTLLLLREPEKTYYHQALVALLYFQVLGLMGSQSRGAYIIFFLEVLLLLPAYTREFLSQLIPLLALCVVIAAKDWSYIFAAGNAKSPVVLLLPIAGVAVLLLLDWLLARIIKLLTPRIVFRAIAVLAIVGMLGGGLYVAKHYVSLSASLLTNPSPVNQAGGASVAQRVQSISAGDHNVQERLVFYKNAWQMALTRPLLGFGANGWPSAYRAFQDYMYNSNETHSEIMRVLVESGFSGVIAYLLLWAGAIILWLKSWRNRQQVDEYIIGVGLIAIFLHSSMDFDLSESSIFFAMIILMASLRASISSIPVLQGANGKIWRVNGLRLPYIMIPLSSLVLLLSLALCTGPYYDHKATAAMKSGQSQLVETYERQSLIFNPFQSQIYADLAQRDLAKGLQQNNPQEVRIALSEIQKATSLSPMDPFLSNIAAQIYRAAGDPATAYKESQKQLQLASVFPQSYEAVGTNGIQYAISLIQQNQKPQADIVLKKIIGLPNEIEARLNKITPKEKALWILDPHLQVTDLLRLRVAQAQALSGQGKTALETFKQLEGQQVLTAEAQLWEGCLLLNSGDQQGDQLISNALKLDPKFKSSVEPIKNILAGVKNRTQ